MANTPLVASTAPSPPSNEQQETSSLAERSKVTGKDCVGAIIVFVISAGLSFLIAVLCAHGGKSLSDSDAAPSKRLASPTDEDNIPDVSIICFIVAFGVNFLGWIPSSILKTEHFYDLTGGLAYVSTAAVSFGTARRIHQGQTWLQILPVVLLAIWSIRLSGFLFYRVRTSTRGDRRFDNLKLNAIRFSVPWSLQGMWVLVVAMPVAVQVSNEGALSSLIPAGELGGLPHGVAPTSLQIFFDCCTVFGLLVWVLGFALEVKADFEKLAFSRNTSNRGRYIHSGVWSWCRHPNYFGEISLWFGMFILGCRFYVNSQWIVVTSPLLTALLLLKVSGLPMLEEAADAKWGHEPEYQEYKKKVHVIIPFL